MAPDIVSSLPAEDARLGAELACASHAARSSNSLEDENLEAFFDMSSCQADSSAFKPENALFQFSK